MDWTTLSVNYELTDDWKFFDLGDFNVVRVSTLSAPPQINEISVMGRYELGQFNSEGTGCNLRQARWELFPVCYQVSRPVFFDNQLLGIRLAPDFSQFRVKIEGITMSMNTSGAKPIATAIPRDADIGTAVVKILPANANRIGFLIRNNTKGKVWFDFNDSINVATNDFLEVIPSGATYESNSTYNGDVYALGESAIAEKVYMREITQ